MSPSTALPHDHRLAPIRQHGIDAVAFQALESRITWWHDDGPEGTGAAVAYVTAGRSWIAVGRPLADAAARPRAARRFAQAAHAMGHRAVFLAVESLADFEGFHRLAVGLQPIVPKANWSSTLRARRTLREQIRRARAKGVVPRVVDARELGDGAPLRAHVARLQHEWLGRKRLEPMGFLVAVEPFHAPQEHLYVVAERSGQPVQFLSAVPVYQRRGWLVEDVLRGAEAPNGTSELMLDHVMRSLDDDEAWITPGVTPLVGEVPWWLNAGRLIATPLYDFAGLRRFRARLSPARWDPVWVVWDRGAAPLVLLDVLHAFAEGRLMRFAWRSLVRHPNGPPWAVAVPLVPWTAMLAALAATNRTALLGWSRGQLVAWTAFDTGLAVLLFRAARQPRARTLAALSAVAAVDAVLSIRHLAATGLGPGPGRAGLRVLATIGPVVGTLALAWAAWRARRTRP